MNKIIGLLAVTFILLSCFLVPSVSAVPTVELISYFYGGAITWIYDEHPSDSSYTSAKTANFTVTDDYYLFYVAVNARTYEYINADFKVVLMNSSMSVLEESETISTSAMSETQTWYNFTFSGTTQLTDGTSYVIGIYSEDAVILDTTNKLGLNTYGYSSSLGKHYQNGTWVNGFKLSYYMYGASESGTPDPTPTPTSTPVGGGDSGDELLADWTEIIVDWLIPLLLILVPAFLGLKFLGQLGFIVGLNVGVIIAYAAGVDGVGLWTVILMGVVDLVVFYMGRR